MTSNCSRNTSSRSSSSDCSSSSGSGSSGSSSCSGRCSKHHNLARPAEGACSTPVPVPVPLMLIIPHDNMYPYQSTSRSEHSLHTAHSMADAKAVQMQTQKQIDHKRQSLNYFGGERGDRWFYQAANKL